VYTTKTPVITFYKTIKTTTLYYRNMICMQNI